MLILDDLMEKAQVNLTSAQLLLEDLTTNLDNQKNKIISKLDLSIQQSENVGQELLDRLKKFEVRAFKQMDTVCNAIHTLYLYI